MDFDEGYFEKLGRSPEVTGLCESTAQEVATIARASAPVDTEAYRDGIRVEIQRRSDRNAAVVRASDWKSMLVESKTGNLARALKAAKRG